MARSRSEFVARPVAPEDIRNGEFIAVLEVIAERVPGCWCDVDAFQPLKARRFVRLPQDDCNPLEVLGVCLPFVFVRQHDGDLRTLDVRRLRFARLEKAYARRAISLLKKLSRSSRRKDEEKEDQE
jgi:hypothetical protein